MRKFVNEFAYSNYFISTFLLQYKYTYMYILNFAPKWCYHIFRYFRYFTILFKHLNILKIVWRSFLLRHVDIFNTSMIQRFIARMNSTEMEKNLHGRNADLIGCFWQTRHNRKVKDTYWLKVLYIQTKQCNIEWWWATESITLLIISIVYKCEKIIYNNQSLHKRKLTSQSMNLKIKKLEKLSK